MVDLVRAVRAELKRKGVVVDAEKRTVTMANDDVDLRELALALRAECPSAGPDALPAETRPSTPPGPETRSYAALERMAVALEAIARAMGPRGVRFYVPGEDDAVREDGDG